MNIVEFAAHAKVSTATISRAFHEPHKLRALTRDRILALAAGLGYYPSPSGRALVRGRHDVLGLIWPLEVEGPGAVFVQQILAVLTEHLVKNDLDLLICPVDRRKNGNLAHARKTLQRSRCDAWILLYPRRNDVFNEILGLVTKPVICFMGGGSPRPAWKSVCVNQRAWIEQALERLRASGCRKVLFFGCRPDEPDHEERLTVFAREAPRCFGKRTVIAREWPPDVRKLPQMLAAGVDGIIGVDDRAALMALEECKRLKIPVPERVRIVGIDDIPAASLSAPALSTFRQPLDKMVVRAVDIALGKSSRSKSFHAVFVPRETLE